MHMIGQPYEETDPDLVVALLGPGEGPDDDLVHQGTGTEQETAVEGTAGDLDQGSSFGDEADSSAHTPEDGKSGPKLIRPRTAWVCEGGGNRSFQRFRTKPSKALRELGGTSKAASTRRRLWHRLEFVQRRGQPLQAAVLGDEVEVQRRPVRQQQGLVALPDVGLEVAATGLAVVDAQAGPEDRCRPLLTTSLVQ